MANTFTLIETISLNSSQSAVVFGNSSSIPQTYNDLKIVASVRTDRGATNDYINIYFNTDSNNANYSGSLTYGGGSGTPTSSTFSSVSANRYAGDVNGNTSPTNSFSSTEIYINDYTNGLNKIYHGDTVTTNNASNVVLSFFAGKWTGTSYINKITFAPGVGSNFLTGTIFSLYGINY